MGSESSLSSFGVPSIAELRGAHSGRTAVVLAGGPSASGLRVLVRSVDVPQSVPLNKWRIDPYPDHVYDWIAQQVTIGVNLPPSWIEPRGGCTYAVQSDYLVANPDLRMREMLPVKHKRQLEKLVEWREKGTTKLCLRHSQAGYPKEMGSVLRLIRTVLPDYLPDYLFDRVLSMEYETWEGTALPVTTRSTTPAAIWLGVLMGCNPIVVLGLDVENTPSNEPVPHHYDDEIVDPTRPQRSDWPTADIEEQFARMHKAARGWFGTRIVNGNPRSEIKTFDKIDIHDIVTIEQETGVLCG